MLSDQNDDKVYFHLVNMTYGNELSPFHVPNKQDTNDERDKFDAYCTIFSDPEKGSSACYVPKFFPKGQKLSRCAKLEFPSMNGFGLCSTLLMARMVPRYDASMTTIGPDTDIEEWVARLAIDDPITPSEYDGELRLFMQNVKRTRSDDPPLKVPLTHWLTSDDQSLETSFQVMNWEAWDSSTLPDVPVGCEDAFDLVKGIDEDHRGRSLTASHGLQLREKLEMGRCPFGAIHRHLVAPSVHMNPKERK